MSAIPAMTVIDAERGYSYTQYTIKGAYQAVCDAVGMLFKEYDPRGYGTKVRSLEMEQDGTYVALVWRGNSCE